MITIRDTDAIIGVTDPAIRQLLETRFAQLCDGSDDPYDADMLGYLILVEPGDTVAQLESECGCPILHNQFEPEIHYGDPDFVHSAEAIEDHGCCYELTFILGGDFGIGMFIPKTANINPELLAMCAEYASTARTPYASPA